MRRRAFTLIELLITALLLVVVSGFAVVIFGSTVSMTTESTRNTGAASQLKQALDVIERAYTQSDATTAVNLLNSVEPGTEGTVLIMYARIPTSSGQNSGTSERRIYCSKQVSSGLYRLAQFTTSASGNVTSQTSACDEASLATVVGGTVSAPVYLTDPQSSITRFTVHNVGHTTNPAITTSQAIRVEITSVPSSSAGEARADTSGISRPLTVRATAVRNFQNNIQPFNGIAPINGQ